MGSFVAVLVSRGNTSRQIQEQQHGQIRVSPPGGALYDVDNHRMILRFQMYEGLQVEMYDLEAEKAKVSAGGFVQ